jgi:hypothetical protein
MILPFDSDLEPVIYEKLFNSIKKDRDWQLMELDKCAEEPWYWIVNYCWTWRPDETKGGLETIIERVPPKDYLRVIVQDWFENPKYLLSKSRQLMATWMMMILLVHRCLFAKNIKAFCQTKKEDDADSEMIQRARFVYDNMPGWMRKSSPAKYSYCKLIFGGTDSFMRGIPQGGDQIRSHNPNILVSDEFAFQNDAEEAYTAALACCKRITLVSSANPGFMRDLVKDKIRPGL